jgi:hypothetical protein
MLCSRLFVGPVQHEFIAFDKKKRELHTCAYCGHRTLKFCNTCNSLGRGRIAVCGRKSGRNCIDLHAGGKQMKHASYNIIRESVTQDAEEGTQEAQDTQDTPQEVAPRRKRRRRRCADGSGDEEE